MTHTLFGVHIAHLRKIYDTALTRAADGGQPVTAILLHSGSEKSYFGDDQHINFVPFGHFSHWLPIPRPDQFVLVRAGCKPVYLQVVPNDYWYEQSAAMTDDWQEQFEVIRLNRASAVAKHVAAETCVYLGDNPALADSWGIEPARCNPAALLAYLDFHRAVKSHYELEQLRHANKLALAGHAAARDCFQQGGNEYAIHREFLAGCGILEVESPYTNIVALDEKSAILHYQNKRREPLTASKVLLIDAGCRINAYCSDITRTWVKDTTPALFKALVQGMDTLQQSLVATVVPGMHYPELHTRALRGIATLLIEQEICRGTPDDLCAQQIPQWFMPHGVGHLLGVQVHDVGGHLQDEFGTLLAPPGDLPYLRNTRTMVEDMVFTVEPGLYFIPLILEEKRNTGQGKCVNWSIVDELYACGGIRIEDNIRVRNDAAENLTRQFEKPY